MRQYPHPLLNYHRPSPCQKAYLGGGSDRAAGPRINGCEGVRLGRGIKRLRQVAHSRLKVVYYIHGISSSSNLSSSWREYAIPDERLNYLVVSYVWSRHNSHVWVSFEHIALWHVHNSWIWSSTPLFGGSSTPAFGASATPSLFGASTSPAFGASSSPSIFGASTTPTFGATSSPSLFGASTTTAFGTPTPSLFGGSSFGASAAPSIFPSATPATFGASSTPLFGGSAIPAFGATSTPSLFGSGPASAFGGTSAQPAFGSNLFGSTPTPSAPPFGQTQPSLLTTTPQAYWQNGQLTTQMAPMAPLSIPLPDRELQVIIDAYKDDLGNPRYAFRHLLLSVTDPSMRVKPLGISDIMWAEAMNKLEGMDSVDRERLWPELVQGFKDLSRRLKMQDEALAADVQRLQATEANVKSLQRHFEIDTVPWMQKLRQKEQELQRKLLKMMRVVEALEGKGFRMPLTKGEAQLSVRLQNLAQQLAGPRAELPRRVDGLLSSSRMRVSSGAFSHALLPGNNKIDDQSLVEMHKVLVQQTDAIGRLVNVLKRDIRDTEIMTADEVQ
ncbi:hypothetical protein GOP47_0021352 [Adiantum capillus-veneris]|uniref:Nucleoporin Nup54 alpha-helical domain-containing protein n=1 Tax=Adiantum capillus-veneris TaxID=13818 RepID=A0A9D4U7Y9_ADICA|nr:hypothetical protein GOP47_0021352 [Adiantum capillus-veneris]